MGISFNGDSKIPWDRPEGCPAGFEPVEIVVGFSNFGGMALEIAITRWTKKEPPTAKELNRLHTIRTNKRATPVVLVVELDSGGTLLFGPKASAAAVGPLPTEQSQRIVQSALDESSVFEARKRLAALVLSIDSTSMPGVSNSGLFANHELKVGVPKRADWVEACKASNPLLKLKGKELIEKLGYQTGQFGAHALLLTGSGPKAEALAVLLNDQEAFDADSPRFTVSPVAYGLNMADKQGVPWLILVRGNQIRLYSSRKDFGVGRKGLAETFFEVDLPQLTTANSGYLQLIFSAKALAEGGTTYEILKSSTQYAVALGERLRDKVYEDIIPELSVAVADALMEKGYDMDPAGCDLAYQLTLRVFFRMLFQVYAEDRKLLPYGENENYDHNAIKTRAKNLAKNPDQIFDENSSAFWDDLMQVWRVIDSGDKAWGVPAYNGGLFSSDSELSEHGSILSEIRIMNDVMGPVLKALLLDEAEDGSIGPVDFRSLSVREFGTIYEGLLESSLGLAEVDLTLDDDGTWIPAKKKDEIYAYAGQVYFHNTSGQRKGTGSYFTPSFVVEHLLERSLDPALDSHLGQVAVLMKKGDHAGAAEKFFDFRVADLAMGSGHFLTSAIDHIEQKMAAFLAEDGQSIPGVAAELLKLEKAAKDALGEDSVELERSSLLRRQIARRCIYGLDINPIAVELARVSIWIHTFVRGLPMSSLDHNLVCANSLTGIGSVDEALDVLVPGRKGRATLFDEPIEKALESARTVLVDAAMLAEATKDESRAASRAAKKAYKDAEKARLLFDAAVLNRTGRGVLVDAVDPEAISKLAAKPASQTAITPLNPAHMPALFPEVFLRGNSGFDVLIGNPPWKQTMVDEVDFWNRVEPGLHSLSPKERESRISQLGKRHPEQIELLQRERLTEAERRNALISGPYPGLGSGGRAPDLYPAFAWRNLTLLRNGGSLGVVLPRSILSGSINHKWRETVLNSCAIEVTTLHNKKSWVFGISEQLSIVLLILEKMKPNNGVVNMFGPFRSLDEWEIGINNSREIPVEVISEASDELAFPEIEFAEDIEPFVLIGASPKFGLNKSKYDFRTVAEFNATSDKSKFSGGTQGDGWPVIGGKGFNLWNPDTGKIYEWAKPSKVRSELRRKLLNQTKLKNSVFFGWRSVSEIAKCDLPCDAPRIAFRDLARAKDERTIIACLIPSGVILTNKAPYLLRFSGTESDEAFVLGVLSSIPLDWYARRYVELGVNFHVFNRLPIPDVSFDDSRRERVVQLAGELAAVDERYRKWADAVGVQTGTIRDQVAKESHINEIDALVSHMYGLNRSHIQHIFSTFQFGSDYSSRLEQVLAFYDQLPKVKS